MDAQSYFRKSVMDVCVLIVLLLCTQTVACKTSGSALVKSGNGKDLVASFPNNFYFGVATAPAHVEDNLDDIWLDFARSRNGKAVRAWSNAGFPELRLNFYSEYQTEIDLAKRLGSQVFRLGVDWGRLVPVKPKDSCPEEAEPCYVVKLEPAALARYQEIIHYIEKQRMTPMLTLYHHSLPKWLQDSTVDRQGKKNAGGWTNPDAVAYFESFAKALVPQVKNDIDIYVIFNEPAVFASLAYSAGIWPPAKGVNILSVFDLKFFKGDFIRAVEHMVAAHKKVYKVIRDLDQQSSGRSFTRGPASVGIAHNVGFYTSGDPVSGAIATLMRNELSYRFIDGVIDQLDFLGLNYYGEEHIQGTAGLAPRKDCEYSESGRGVNPNGFYTVLRDFHDKYLKNKRSLPIIITENGISDSTDWLRPAYLIEHLIALDAARKAGMDIQGYVFWTLSDNWEWADGYCPKFGLAEVDRSSPALKRRTRASFDLYQTIIASHQITRAQRDAAWQLVRDHVGQNRPFCRNADGSSSLDVPEQRPVIDQDWRFNAAVLSK